MRPGVVDTSICPTTIAAVAADLVRRGVTQPRRIVAERVSNGVLLIANMLTRYPESSGTRGADGAGARGRPCIAMGHDWFECIEDWLYRQDATEVGARLEQLRLAFDALAAAGIHLTVHSTGTMAEAFCLAAQSSDARAALEEGITLAIASGDAWCRAELHRRKGELLLDDRTITRQKKNSLAQSGSPATNRSDCSSFGPR
jgi:hypothetical protein